MQKENLVFGSGHFVEVLNDPAFHELSIREQARIVGWADGCPVVTELTDPDNPNPGRGPEAMLDRYGEVNQWFTFIGRAIEDVNPQLAREFNSPVMRNTSEPVGPYEPESVDEGMYRREMAPLGTAWGYAMPRLLTKQIGEGTQEENQERLMRALEALDVAINTANSPAELLAVFAEELVDKADLSVQEVLKGTLSKGWFDEHNAVSMCGEVKAALQANAPELWGLYSQLSDGAKQDLKVA